MAGSAGAEAVRATDAAPGETNGQGIHGREVVFDDGTRFALPPDANIQPGKTPDGTVDTLTLSVPPNPPLVLTLADPLHRAPVLSVDALRTRCQAGAWIEITRNDKTPALRGKVRWAVGMTRVEGRPAILFADRTALPLPDNERDLHFKDDGATATGWSGTSRKGSGHVKEGYEPSFRFRNDLPRRDRR